MARPKRLIEVEPDSDHKHTLHEGLTLCKECGLHTHKETYEDAMKFTGVARSVEAYDNQGFNNFRIVTLHIENGVVVKVHKSDPYQNFELIAMNELVTEKSIINLNNNWADKKVLSK